MGIYLGGAQYSHTQIQALLEVADRGQSRLESFQIRTRRRLARCGLIEAFVPEATTLAMAERGRVRYYRLTEAGRAAAAAIRARKEA
jgi:hypothetical protein